MRAAKLFSETTSMPAHESPDRPEIHLRPEDLERLRGLMPRLAELPELAERLRERKKLQTRAELSWAAIKLALERGGLEHIRTDEIAAAAGVSPRTFNNYFRSREEAIGSVAGDRARRVALALADRPADEPFAEAVVAAVIAEYTWGHEPDKAVVFQLRSLMMTDCGVRPFMLNAMTKLEDELTPVFAARLELPADDLLSRVLAAAVNGAIRVATEYWLREDVDTPYTALLRQAVSTAAGLAEHVRPARDLQASLPENTKP